MDSNTELLLNITKQLGGLSADMSTVKDSMQSFKDEILEIRKEIRTHEGIHVDLATKKSIDELWEQQRKNDKRLSTLENKDAQKALEDQKKIRDQLISIFVGVIGLALVGFLIYGVAENLIRNIPK